MSSYDEMAFQHAPTRDYTANYWYFEIVQFLATAVLSPCISTSKQYVAWWSFSYFLLCLQIVCGIASLLPAEGVSQVFLSLLVASAMLLAYANCR
jgi:hypothetical protein